MARTARINGQRWRIDRSKKLLPKLYGRCDYSQRLISVCRSLSGVPLLDTLIHEVIHARWPDLSEEAVEEVASTLAAIITKEGFVDGQG